MLKWIIGYPISFNKISDILKKIINKHKVIYLKGVSILIDTKVKFKIRRFLIIKNKKGSAKNGN